MSSNPTYCFDSLTERGCPLGQRCQRRHDIRRCSCDLVILSNDFKQHVEGKRHRALLVALGKLQGPATPAGTRQSSTLRRPPQMQASVRCELCNKDLPPSQLSLHMEQHKKQQQWQEAKAAFEQALEQDRNGITVSGRDGVDLGVVEAEELSSVDVTITKTDSESRISLSSFCMASSTRKDGHGITFSAALSGQSRWINNGRPRSLVITCHPSYAGRYQDVLELVFFDMIKKQRFLITRRICAIAGSKDDHEFLKAKSPYVKRKFTPYKFEGFIIRSLRPPTWSRTKWTAPLPEFKAPDNLIHAAFHRDGKSTSRRAISQFIPSSFNSATYGKCFQVMLHIEEEQMRQDLEMYSMEGVELQPNHPRYNLQVEGLSEGRPSVLVGDFILVRHQGANDGPWYEGRVHQVYQRHVSLHFCEEFSTYKGTTFDVRFQLNRLPIRRAHQALVNSFNPTRLLFPGPEHLMNAHRGSLARLSSITPVNRLIGEDVEQLETVDAIMHQVLGSVPFIVFGPPGTGKTVTIVEAMRQLLIRDPNIRILACAPSNSAADLIAQRLAVLGTSQVFRLNALSRRLDTLPETLRRFSLVNDNRVFAIPSLEEMRKFRVIVSTCVTAGVASNLGMKQGHFSHIFIDEAGQIMEPGLMIPIKTMADASTNVILAGDDKQLGPIIRSQLAASLGLKESYLARMMKRDVYDLTKGRGVTIVKLVKNFRSHAAILEFPNSEFYNGELQPSGNPALTHSLEHSNELVTKKFPLIFHGVIGKDQREASSPSFFNIDEATIVKKYCLSLITDRKNRIRSEDIGVITPYHAQACKILNLLHRDHKLKGITVGSVEEFQGQERRVILMSTVRSSADYVTSDIKATLGFVANPRRFNVAITRAQALLIVVGNPNILALDPLWRRFLRYIHSRGGWRGKEMKWNLEDDTPPEPDGSGGEIRKRAQDKVEATITRLKALIAMKNEESDYNPVLSPDVESDSDSDLERPGSCIRQGWGET